MIGAILGAAAGIGSSIFSGVKAAKAARKAKKQLEQEKAENAAWYNRRINEDATQRADAQRAIRLAQEEVRNRNREAAGTQAVVGGTDESVAATKEANAKAISDTMSNIAANAEAQKSQIEESYRNQNRTINQGLNNIEQQRATNIANAGVQAVKALGSVASSVDDYLDNKTRIKPQSTAEWAKPFGDNGAKSDAIANKIADNYIRQINGAKL